jgi:hypothetical protein
MCQINPHTRRGALRVTNPHLLRRLAVVAISGVLRCQSLDLYCEIPPFIRPFIRGVPIPALPRAARLAEHSPQS